MELSTKREPRICVNCAGPFMPRWESDGGTYCSRECYADWRRKNPPTGSIRKNGRPMYPRTCENCKCEFFARSDYKGSCCSMDCAQQLIIKNRQDRNELHPSNRKISRICPVCTSEFSVSPAFARIVHCSRECLKESRKKLRRVKQCRGCGKDVHRLACQLKACPEPFCSPSCRSKFAITCRVQSKTSKIANRFLDMLERKGLDLIREHPIKHFRIDGYVPAVNIAIEFDGFYWHSTDYAKERDDRKDREMLAQGMRVIRVPELAFMEDPNRVIESVMRRVKRYAKNMQQELFVH